MPPVGQVHERMKSHKKQWTPTNCQHNIYFKKMFSVININQEIKYSVWLWNLIEFVSNFINRMLTI